MDRAVRRQVLGILLLSTTILAAAFLLSPAEVARFLIELAASPALFLLLIGAGYLVRFLVAWPISAFSVLVGFVLGPIGIPVALVGAGLTCLPPYLLAVHLDGEEGPLSGITSIGDRYFSVAGDVRGVAAARLAPIPADAVSYTAGLAQVRLSPFVAGTLIGELPWVSAAVLVGASAERLTTDGIASPALVVGALSLAVLLLASPAYQLLRGRLISADP